MYSKTIILGRLTQEPEVKTINGKNKVLNFGVAVSRSFKNADGERDTDFYNVVAWNERATFIADYFHKGDAILVAGQMQSRHYEDKDGTDRTIWELHASEVSFTGASKNDSEDTSKRTSNTRRR